MNVDEYPSRQLILLCLKARQARKLLFFFFFFLTNKKATWILNVFFLSFLFFFVVSFVVSTFFFSCCGCCCWTFCPLRFWASNKPGAPFRSRFSLVKVISNLNPGLCLPWPFSFMFFVLHLMKWKHPRYLIMRVCVRERNAKITGVLGAVAILNGISQFIVSIPSLPQQRWSEANEWVLPNGLSSMRQRDSTVGFRGGSLSGGLYCFCKTTAHAAAAGTGTAGTGTAGTSIRGCVCVCPRVRMGGLGSGAWGVKICMKTLNAVWRGHLELSIGERIRSNGHE